MHDVRYWPARLERVDRTFLCLFVNRRIDAGPNLSRGLQSRREEHWTMAYRIDTLNLVVPVELYINGLLISAELQHRVL